VDVSFVGIAVGTTGRIAVATAAEKRFPPELFFEGDHKEFLGRVDDLRALLLNKSVFISVEAAEEAPLCILISLGGVLRPIIEEFGARTFAGPDYVDPRIKLRDVADIAVSAATRAAMDCWERELQRLKRESEKLEAEIDEGERSTAAAEGQDDGTEAEETAETAAEPDRR